MTDLDTEYQRNEVRHRAALTAEDTERREAGADLETRESRQWDDLVSGFELRQAVFNLDEGRALTGKTAEVVEEMRSAGGYRGVPVPLAAMLETRAGETVASGTPNPMQTMPIVDRLFAQTVAARMGVATVNIGQGEREYPVVSSSIAAGWADGELANVAGPSVFTTVDKSLAPGSQLWRAAAHDAQGAETIRRGSRGGDAARHAQRDAGRHGQGRVPRHRAPMASRSASFPARPPTASPRRLLTRHRPMPSSGGRRCGSCRATRSAPMTEIRALIRPETWDALEDQAAATSAPMWEWDRLSRPWARATCR